MLTTISDNKHTKIIMRLEILAPKYLIEYGQNRYSSYAVILNTISQHLTDAFIVMMHSLQ